LVVELGDLFGEYSPEKKYEKDQREQTSKQK
jgi:hypothetical protein